MSLYEVIVENDRSKLTDRLELKLHRAKTYFRATNPALNLAHFNPMAGLRPGVPNLGNPGGYRPPMGFPNPLQSQINVSIYVHIII